MLRCSTLDYLDEDYECPYCKEKLSCCSTPPFHIGDGLGWGSEYIFVCLNDKCSIFVNSWQQFDEKYGQPASCRYIQVPGEKKGTPMMVGSSQAFTGSIVDPKEIKNKDERYIKEKKATTQLDTCVEKKDIKPILRLILDESANLENRNRACDLIKEVCDFSCIDPIRNHKFLHTEIEQRANMAISAMLKEQFKKECPYCTEIIKTQATICKHCGKEL